MKTSSDALFRLIKAMTKGEKTYFKKFTSSSGTVSNYFKLFDAIAKSSVYNEDALLKKFRKESFVKNFVETKQYLKTQILKALRNYNSNRSIVFKLREELSEIELLIEKGIFDLARTQIKKTLKTAQEHELIHYVFEINKIQLHLSKSLLDFKALETYQKETVPEEEEGLKKLAHIQYYAHRYVNMYVLSKKQGVIQYEQMNVDEKEHPRDSFNAAHLHLATKLSIGQILGEPTALYKDAKVHYELFQKHPKQIDLIPVYYFACISLYGMACAKVNEIKEGLRATKEGIDLLQLLHKKNKISYHFFVNYIVKLYNNELRLYLHHGSKTLFKENYLAYKELMNQYKETSSTAYIDLTSVFFSEIILEEWDAAEDSYQVLVNTKIRGYREDIECILRLLGVLVYYENKNDALLEAAIDAAYQFIRTKDFLFKFARDFINLFKHKILKAVNRKEEIQHLIAFKAKTLAFFEEEPQERNVLAYFDFIAWLNSKIEDRSVHEAYWQRMQVETIE
ncbi:MAG: hypothetical protein ACRBFS_10815 [Aureispira sp.]